MSHTSAENLYGGRAFQSTGWQFNRINFGLEFWPQKQLEIPFEFCDISKLPSVELFVSVGNLKPKLKLKFFY